MIDVVTTEPGLKALPQVSGPSGICGCVCGCSCNCPCYCEPGTSNVVWSNNYVVAIDTASVTSATSENLEYSEMH
jgi:hypothetical protein